MTKKEAKLSGSCEAAKTVCAAPSIMQTDIIQVMEHATGQKDVRSMYRERTESILEKTEADSMRGSDAAANHKGGRDGEIIVMGRLDS